MGFQYLQPESVDEAIACRKAHRGSYLLAGGTDLLVRIHAGRLSPSAVIGLGRVKELDAEITAELEGVRIGALAVLTDVARNTTVATRFPALQQAAASVGSRQIRNRATLVGNLCNASPAADTVPPLLIYEARVMIANGRTSRQVALEEFFTGPGKSILTEDELVVGVWIPYPAFSYCSAYRRISRRRGVDLSLAGVAGLVADTGEVRLALGAVGPKPFRARQSEGLLKGYAGDEARLEAALACLIAEAAPITDIRASRAYRLEMIQVLATRVLRECAMEADHGQ